MLKLTFLVSKKMLNQILQKQIVGHHGILKVLTFNRNKNALPSKGVDEPMQVYLAFYISSIS